MPTINTDQNTVPETVEPTADKKIRGRGITLLKKVMTMIDGVQVEVFVVVETENDGMRSRADVKRYLNEQEYIGTVYPTRIDMCITRAEQTKVGFKEGE